MRKRINDYPVIRDITINDNRDNPMRVCADEEFLYIPQVIMHKDQRTIYYLEIPKKLLQEGVGTIDD